MNLKHKLCLGAAAVAVACATGPSATALSFNDALWLNYVDFANHGVEKEVSYGDTAHFQCKASNAAQATPEQLANWNLLPFHREELSTARGRLDRALRSGVTRTYPKVSARAQAKFDCWVERAEEKWDDVKTAECRRAFYDALETLEAVAGEREVAVVATAFSEADLTIFFDFDSADLTGQERDKLRRVAGEFKRSRHNTVYLEGHADKVGNPSYNLDLSARRAQSVKRVLVDSGVPASKVQVVAEGESDPLVPTDDGVRESRNRRVWLTFK